MISHLQNSFERIGARVKEGAPARRSFPLASTLPVSFNVLRDEKGEYFSIIGEKEALSKLVVLDVQPRDRHLLLLSRSGRDKHRFLLGHDERHWFVAAVAEATPVSTVQAAKTALKPQIVLERERGLRAKEMNRRRNPVRIRQGEWFFVPSSGLKPDPFLVLKKEPLRRGGGKPHMCDELFRFGGETVYVSRRHPNGLTEAAYYKLDRAERDSQRWTTMRRNPRVYVRGRIRHPDHETITLIDWHEVFMNTESQALAMRSVAFLD
jgi:hypothetical protein